MKLLSNRHGNTLWEGVEMFYKEMWSFLIKYVHNNYQLNKKQTCFDGVVMGVWTLQCTVYDVSLYI
jgi:hypothetical protein